MATGKTVVAVDLQTTVATLALVNREQKVLARASVQLGSRSRNGAMKQIISATEELICASPRSIRPTAIGVVIDATPSGGGPKAGSQQAFAARLQKKIGIPVVTEHSRNATVLGETCAGRGAAKGKSDVVALIVGQTISAGIMSGGKLCRGAHDMAGSAGWMTVTLADCLEVRQFGCLEAYASAPGILRTAKASIEAGFGGGMTAIGHESLTIPEIAALARKGDACAKEIFRRVARLLGLGIANLINLFDPQVVVFGGELTGIADCLWDDTKRTALERCEPQLAKKTRILLSKLGDEARLHGIAQLAFMTVEPARKIGARAGE